MKLKIGDKVRVVNKNKIWNKDLATIPKFGIISDIIDSPTTGCWYALEGDEYHRYYEGGIELLKSTENYENK